jgi:nitrogen regulatory protein P-II 1
MTVIQPEHCRLIERSELPLDWAAELGQAMELRLGTERLDQLQERVVCLDAGVLLAHLRTPRVEQPTMGAFKLRGASDDQQPWLWMVVLIPQADASRHLGWMAHLAAGLHDEESRQAVFQAEANEELVEGLVGLLVEQTHRFAHLPRPEAAATAAPSPDDANKLSSSFRLIVAILKEETFVDDLLALFVEHDVRGATVLEARGMAEHLAAHMSLFAGFRSAFKAVGHSQVVLSLVPNHRTEEVLEMIRLSAGGMDTPGAGIAFAVDVPYTLGLNKD